jgi:uncharacterized protein YecE (DUF72 family)
VPVWIGTSGWQYDHWRSTVYPKEVPKSRWLSWYAERFATVESNSAFYRLPEKKLFERWAEATPPDFVMSVKASRFLTHIRRLREPKDPIERLLERVRGLGNKQGPILLQLPPNLVASTALLEGALASFPKNVKVAFEPRHESWFVDDVREVLEKHRAALCLTDRRNRKSPLWRTASWTYVRFHEGTASPAPSYGRTALDSWAARIASLWNADDEVYCYFNNDQNGRAPIDATTSLWPWGVTVFIPRGPRRYDPDTDAGRIKGVLLGVRLGASPATRTSVASIASVTHNFHASHGRLRIILRDYATPLSTQDRRKNPKKKSKLAVPSLARTVPALCPNRHGALPEPAGVSRPGLRI